MLAMIINMYIQHTEEELVRFQLGTLSTLLPMVPSLFGVVSTAIFFIFGDSCDDDSRSLPVLYLVACIEEMVILVVVPSILTLIL